MVLSGDVATYTVQDSNGTAIPTATGLKSHLSSDISVGSKTY
jgi:hypothetical protein